MRRPLRYVVLLVLAAALLGAVGAVAEKRGEPTSIEVFFSPKGGCQDAIIREVNAAKDYVHVQAYSFTSAPIARALLDAKKRGVKVEVVIDKGRVTEKYSEATFFANQDIPVFTDGRHAIAHNKVMVIDGSTVITGSFNFTKAAEESNAENLLVIRSPELAAKYDFFLRQVGSQRPGVFHLQTGNHVPGAGLQGVDDRC